MVKAVTVRFKGRTALQKKLDYLQRAMMPEMNKAVNEAGKLMEKEMKRDAPVRTGALRRSIVARKPSKTKGHKDGPGGQGTTVASSIFASAKRGGYHSNLIQLGSKNNPVSNPFGPVALRRNASVIGRILRTRAKAVTNRAKALQFPDKG